MIVVVTWQRTLLFAAGLVLILYPFTTFRSLRIPQRLQDSIAYAYNSTSRTSSIDYKLAEILRQLWEPRLVPVDAASFTAVDGRTYRLPGAPAISKPFGKKLLILDVDTRPLDGEGEILNKKVTFDKLHRLSAGMLSHYLYAMIHGYDYKFIRSPDYPDRQAGWTKVIMTKEMLKSHEIVLTVDSDATMVNLELPLEWLMNFWEITEEFSIALALDPDLDENLDSQGNLDLNTGFVFNRQGKRTQEIYNAWAECPTERRFQGCAKWKWEYLREQTAFAEHIRYEYQDDIRVLPCTEANGYPQHDLCKGLFVRHPWTDKNLVKPNFAESVLEAFVPLLHQAFTQEAIIDFKNKTLHDAVLLDPEEDRDDD